MKTEPWVGEDPPSACVCRVARVPVGGVRMRPAEPPSNAMGDRRMLAAWFMQPPDTPCKEDTGAWLDYRGW